MLNYRKHTNFKPCNWSVVHLTSRTLLHNLHVSPLKFRAFLVSPDGPMYGATCPVFLHVYNNDSIKSAPD